MPDPTPPQRLFVWFVQCDPKPGSTVPGASARAYVIADTQERSLELLLEWIQDSDDYLPTEDRKLLDTWEWGESSSDPEENERIEEAWETEVGSVWFHFWDPDDPDADDDPE
jgi:hypothetical protein